MITIDDLPEEGGNYAKTKKEWEEVDHLYIHYFYKITNNINNKYYYGIHSILKEDPKSNDLVNDGYWGSGTAIHEAEIKYGLENFTKTVEAIFSTRAEVRIYEAEIVTQELVDDRMCYNMVLGGCESPIWQGGWILVNYRDESLRKEKMFSIPTEEYQSNKDKYITSMSGLISVNYRDPEKRLPKFFTISSEEYYKNKDLYITSFSDKVAYKNKENWEDVRWLSSDDPLVLSGQFIGITKGLKQSQETINKKIGEKNGSYGSFWVTNGKENKKISNQDIPEGWWKGRIIDETKIKYCYINIETGEHKYFLKTENPGHPWFKDFMVDKNLEVITITRLEGYLKDGKTKKELSEIFGICIKSVAKLVKYYIGLGKLDNKYYILKNSVRHQASTKYMFIRDKSTGKVRRVLSEQAKKFLNNTDAFEKL